MMTRSINRATLGVGALFLGAFALQAKDRNWETGKVLDSNSARSILETGATTATSVDGTASTSYNGNSATTSYSGTATSHTNLEYMGIKESDLLIVGKQ